MEVIIINRLLDFEHYLSEEIKAHKVMTVEDEKRQRIITAAMQEFPTDHNCRNAGVHERLSQCKNR